MLQKVRYPENPAIYDRAYQLFVAGKNLTQIHKELCNEFGIDAIKYSTIRTWSIANQWKDRRSGVFIEAHDEIALLEKNRIVKEHKDHLEAYQKVREKGMEALDAVPIDKAGDAIKAVDIGVRGERLIRSSLINLQFAQEILEVIVSCVRDQDTLDKIRDGLRKVVVLYQQEELSE